MSMLNTDAHRIATSLLAGIDKIIDGHDGRDAPASAILRELTDLRDHVTTTDLRRHANEPAHNQEESHE